MIYLYPSFAIYLTCLNSISDCNSKIFLSLLIIEQLFITCSFELVNLITGAVEKRASSNSI